MCSNVGTSISSSSNVISNNGTNIKGINFSSNWSGSAYEQFNQSLNDSLSSLESLTSQLSIFNQALSKLDEYKVICEEIARLESELARISDDDEESESIRASIEGKIASLVAKKNALRAEIESILSSITGVMVQSNSIVSYTYNGGFEYICDLEQLEMQLKGLGDCQNIAVRLDGKNEMGLSGMDYVNYRLNSVCDRYSGREAAVNSILMSLQLSVEAGAKIRYYNPGQNIGTIPYNTNEQLVDGMDCCSYVSWGVNKGTADPFHWEGVQGFMNVGEKIDISSALPGDVLAKSNPDGSGAHVVMVIENNPETGVIKIAESTGGGSKLVTETYDDYQAFSAYSLEKYYTGERSNA